MREREGRRTWHRISMAESLFDRERGSAEPQASLSNRRRRGRQLRPLRGLQVWTFLLPRQCEGRNSGRQSIYHGLVAHSCSCLFQERIHARFADAGQFLGPCRSSSDRRLTAFTANLVDGSLQAFRVAIYSCNYLDDETIRLMADPR